ncbi:MAG: murein biosynthesis integral membrane protein MurJ [Gammaproteobacteria bacterium]
MASMLKSTGLVGGYTLLSRVLGLFRDIVLAKFFAPGPAMDAFLVAFKIPNFMRRLFGEGAFSQAFVPVISEQKSQGSAQDVKDLVDGVAGTLGLFLTVITVLGVLGAPLLVMIFAPGFHAEPERFELTVNLLRITFPYLLFISLTAFAAGILNTFGRFGVPAFTPVLLNLALISAAIWFAPYFSDPITALAWGVLIAGLAQLAIQLPALARIGLVPVPRLGRAKNGVRQIMRLMLPALFGSSVAQINLLVDTLIASFLTAGSISWLYFSDRLMEFPLGVFAIALATVLLPSLSALHTNKDPEAFSRTLDWALRLAFIIGLPAALGLFMLAGPIVVTLFQYGEFSAQDVRMTEISLQAYAIGLFGFTLVKVLAPGYFARQDTRTPVRFGLVAMFTNIVLNLGLVVYLVQSEYFAPHAGLALATSIAALLHGALLFRGLSRAGVYVPVKGWIGLQLRLLAGLGGMGAFLHFFSGELMDWQNVALAVRVVRLVLLVSGGALVYFLFLLLLGLRPGQFKAPTQSEPSV